MTIQQLEYIIALDNYRHFVTAAKKCFVSQPNLTMQVKKLESEIGIEIFDRESKPLKPTLAGEQIITKARQILAEVNHLKEFVSQEKESIKGTFIIGIIPTVAPYLAPMFLGAFNKLYPNTKLIVKELKTQEIIDSIKNNTIDIGLLVTPLNEIGVREIPVYYESFLFYHQDVDAFKTEIDTKKLDRSKLLLLNEGHCFREQALAICDFAEFDIDKQGFLYQSGSIEALINLVDKGLGYTLVPELAVLNRNDLKGKLKRFKGKQPTREVSFVVHNSFTKEKLLDILHQTIKENLPETIETKNRGVRVVWR